MQAYAANYELISKWGSFGSGNGLFEQPGGLSVSPLGTEFYVADSLNNRIQKFFSDGPFITKWGIAGQGNGQMDHPQGVTVDPSGMIVYVTDTGNNRIQKFDSNGTFITSWGSPGSANGLFNKPQGIALDPSGTVVYVTDTGNNRIQKFDSNRTFITSWGSPGSANGLFKQPAGIVVDQSGKIVYVADTGNNRIQKFDSNGNFIAKWGTSGSGDAHFKQPKGVSIDPLSKEILIVDSLNNRIQKFDSNGNFIAKWGTSGSGNGQFKNPYGIALDSKGRVYVSDKKNNNVQLFSSIQNIVQPYLPASPQSAQTNAEPVNLANASLSDLPDTLTITDDSGSDNFLSLRALMINGAVKGLDGEGDFELDNFELNDWFPPVTFQFTEGTSIGLVNVKSVLIGQIKSFKSPSDILKSSAFWERIPLNEQVALSLDHKGNNFMIVEVQFMNGISGIYSASFNMDTFGSKSLGLGQVKDEIKNGADFKIRYDVKFKPDYSESYWQLAQSIACKELEGHGFTVCQ
jgi:DNA-binding beta-propeller fold protein YncE